MADGKEPLVSAQRKFGEGTKQFRSPDQLKKWVDRERESWAWLDQLRRPPSNQILKNLANAYRTRLSQLDAAATALVKGQASEDLERRRAEAQSALENYFLECMDSGLPIPQMLQGVAEEDSLVAGWGLAFAHSHSIPSGDRTAIEGAVRVLLFQLGIKERAQGERRALKRLLADIEDDRNAFSESYEQLSEGTSRRTENAEAVLGSLQQEMNELVLNGRRRLAELEDTYDKKLALRKPVQYWRRKGVTHYSIAGTLLVLLLSAGGLFVYWLVGFTEEFVGAANAIDEPWRYLTTFLIAGLGIWGLRVGVKVLISQLHLASDSRQRATLILTYLALLREGEGLDDKDKELILNIVFAPGQSGLLQEGVGGPSTALDRLAKLISGAGR